ncbi:nuclear transport factor 2 family protein [Bdellovibrio sp. NC01]|uniref:YybH family protein n=1 Tax=Bdellovibrio sp. NC01 TaxID=2220073 RepID=UPI00143D34B4|nr:nuclear transport factor 2 family protein [Bdellovibrio sp. NC01]
MNSAKDFPEKYARAVRNSNVEEFASLYDDDVRIFDMWDEWSMRGRDSVIVMAKEWFGSLGDEHVVVTFSDIEITENAELAILTCFVRFAGHAADGTRLRFLDERMTVNFRKNNSGEWKVIHQHTSVPIESNGMKPIHKRL